MQKERTSIATLVIVTLVTVTTVLLGSWGMVSYLSERSQIHTRIEGEAKTMAQQLAAGLSLPMWNFDQPVIDGTLDNFMQIREVEAVVVSQRDVASPSGTSMHARGRDGQWRMVVLNHAPGDSGQIVHGNQVVHNGELLGTVKVFATSRFAEQALRQSLMSSITRIVALDMLLILILFFLLRRAVILPLRAVEQFASTVSAGGRSSPNDLRRFPRELENLYSSTKKMIALLDARYLELLKSQSMLSVILNSVPQSIFWKDRRGKYLGGNQVFAKAAGVARPELLTGKTDFDLPWAAAADHYRAHDAEVMDSGKTKRHIIEQAVTADGKWIWVDTSKMPLLDEAGKVYGVLGVYEDITEQKNAEDALRYQQEQYRVLFEQSLVGFLIYEVISDSDGKPIDHRIVQANPAAETLTGLSRDELLGRTRAMSNSPFPPELEQRFFNLAFHGGQFSYERLNESLGRYFEVQAFSPKRGQFALIFIDATQRKNAEEMLIETEKMRTVAGLAAGMAHEINNPLAGILQSAEVVLNRVSPELEINRAAAVECGTTVEAVSQYMQRRGISELLGTIQSSGLRAAEIVANMLAFSRGNKAEMRAHSLAELVDRTIALESSDYQSGRFDFLSIEVVREYEPGMPAVPCRSIELQQVIFNLLKNAAQAMGERGQRDDPPRIAIRISRAGERAKIEVEDNGPGMPEELRRRIFEPFFTTKEAKGGTGLGLFVAYLVVTRSHGGEFTVNSIPGKGTTFTILLPLA